MPYFEPGRVRWDPPKDDKAIKKSEQDGRKPFSELEAIFLGSETDGFIVEDDRKDYGERRFWLFREIEGGYYRTTFNMRGHDGGTPWIISGNYISKKKFEKMRDGPAVKHNLARGTFTLSSSLSASAIVTSE